MGETLQRRKCLGTVAYMGGVMGIPEPFAWSWAEMREFSKEALCQEGEYIHADRARVSLHDTARNHLADNMKGDWLLMLDTDLEFDPDLCARMVGTMTKYNLDVLTGVYCFKSQPHTPVLYYWNESTDRTEMIGDWDRSAELFEIGAAGGGCLLIHRRVFDKIKKELGERPFDRMPATNWKGATHGEDHSFFRRLRQVGIKAVCAPKIHCYHLRYDGVDPSHRSIMPTMSTREIAGVLG